ncbi:MAG: 30S ribosomal protein S6 [Eggerthellaceae bacterium]|nr:30S ribosomal protein S6 [Eggerthellaceae bacterium]
MKAYELLYFVAPTLDEDARANVQSRIASTITDAKGAVDNVDDWGKRKLAFEINGLTEGNYILVDFHANPEDVAELDRVLRINDAVVRHMIVRRSDRN